MRTSSWTSPFNCSRGTFGTDSLLCPDRTSPLTNVAPGTGEEMGGATMPQTFFFLIWSWSTSIFQIVVCLWSILRVLKWLFWSILLFSFFWSQLADCGILVPQPGIKLTPPELGAQNLKHWTAGKSCFGRFCLVFWLHFRGIIADILNQLLVNSRYNRQDKEAKK